MAKIRIGFPIVCELTFVLREVYTVRVLLLLINYDRLVSDKVLLQR